MRGINHGTILCLLLSLSGGRDMLYVKCERIRGSSKEISESTMAHRLSDRPPSSHSAGRSLHFSLPDDTHRRGLSKGKPKSKKEKGNDEKDVYEDCDPEEVNLADYPQWRAEEGYWIGTYTFYKEDGKPFESENWNYRYDDYRGFITGSIKGNAYRQRNVFLYPPQFPSVCETTRETGIVGEGSCGATGNSKVFFADQEVTTCSTNPELGGDVEGPYQEIFVTKTELVGEDNALLYQVFFDEALFLSQLTTLTIDSTTGAQRRTRSNQGFFNGIPISLSFFREVKVTKEEFYAQLKATLQSYKILQSDTCTWTDSPSGFGPLATTDYTPGLEGCMEHLEQSFAL